MANDQQTATIPPELQGALQQVQQANAGSSRTPLATVPDGLPDELSQQLKGVAEQEPPRVSPTGQTIEPQPGWQNTWKGITGNLVGGSYGAVKEAAAGLAIGGGLSDFEQQKKQVEDDIYLRAQADAEDYANGPGHNLLTDIIGGGVHVLPMAGIGLGATALGTLATAPFLGPAAPFAGLGFGALTMGTLATGQGIYRHMKQGWSKDHALAGGLFSGAVAAAMQFVGMGASEKAGADTLATLASSPTFRQAVTEVTGHIAKSIGVNVGLAGVTSVADGAVDYLLAAKPKTMQQALSAVAQEFYQSSVAGVLPAAIIGGGAAALGIRARMSATEQHIEVLRKALDHATQLKTKAEQPTLEGHVEESVSADDLEAQRKNLEAGIRRSTIIRAGLAIKTAPNAGAKVLDILANGGTPDEAAEALIDSEPVDKPTGEKDRIRSFNIYKDTAGLNLDGLLRYVFQHVPPAEQEALVRALSIDQASNEAEVNRMLYQQLADTLLKEATGLDDAGLTKLMHDAATTKIKGKWSDGRTIQAPDEYGVMHVMSVDEAISYLLWAENSDAQAALYAPDGNNFPRDYEITLTEAIKALPEGQKYLDALEGFRKFYLQMGKTLKEVHDRATGDDLELQINHGGTIRRVGTVQADMTEIESRLPGQEYVANNGERVESTHNATIERGALTTAIAKRGAFANAHSHAVATANYEANVERAGFWNQFVNDPDVVQGITGKWNKGLLERIRDRYRDQVHGVPAAQQGSIAEIDNIIRANRVSVLGSNPIYTLQHWFTLINFFLARDNEGVQIPFNELSDGFQHFFLNKIEAVNEIQSWDEVKARYADVNTVGGIASGERTPEEVNYEKNALQWFQKGDMPALEAGTYAVYHVILNRTGDAVLAKQTAIQAFKDCLASGSSQQWTDLTTNKITKLFTAFEQPTIRLRQHSFEAKLTANNFPTAKHFQDQLRAELVARTASTVFLAPKLAVAVADAAILHNPSTLFNTMLRMGTTLTFGNMLPGASTIGESVVAAASGGRYDPDVSTPVSRVVIGAAKAAGMASAMATGHTPLSFHHILQTVIGVYQAQALIGKGKPVAPMIWLDKIFGGK
ncbi:MAG TPA: hypothetical protein V6D22_13685 [Candidatus Obscuribacterales bacterium]